MQASLREWQESRETTLTAGERAAFYAGYASAEQDRRRKAEVILFMAGIGVGKTRTEISLDNAT